MKVLVNVFHPNISASVINAMWVKELKQAGTTTINMPYSEYPHWHIDVEREQRLLLEHDRIVFQHPFYWYSIPPLMKKWIDDVLTYNWAYGAEGDALRGKHWMSAISTGEPEDAYRHGGTHKHTMEQFLYPIKQTAELVGMEFLPPFVFHHAEESSHLRSTQSAKQYALHIAQ